jgi:methyl-accepting chemotaxis protein
LGDQGGAGQQESSGAMTRNAAQAQALSELRSMRYGSNDYFWVNGLDIRMVMHLVAAAGSITEYVKNLEISTRRLEAQAADTSRQAEDAATSSEAVVAGYDRVASAVGDIDASIRQIAEHVQQVAAVAGDAVRATDGTNRIVARLGESSAEIDAVVQTITSIAEQTNMLALNATIESARAGEAGRGFAVVATEVKDLAHETAAATDDIAHRIQTLQGDTHESVTAIGSIAEIIAQINEYQLGITAAVEQQSATMAEVSRSVSESSQASAGAGASIAAVALATDQTRRQLDEMAESISSLGRLSHDLEEAVSVFRR